MKQSHKGRLPKSERVIFASKRAVDSEVFDSELEDLGARAAHQVVLTVVLSPDRAGNGVDNPVTDGSCRQLLF